MKSLRYSAVQPQPPLKYSSLFDESFGRTFWAWSKTTSGEGAEQQDLFNMVAPKDNLVPELIDGTWFWVQKVPQ